MVVRETQTPSAQLFEHLVNDTRPDLPQNLIGRRVYFPDLGLRSKVVGIDGHQITHVPFERTERPKRIEPKNRSKNTSSLKGIGFQGLDGKSSGIVVRTEQPYRIGFGGLINFSAEDPNLDYLLNEGLRVNDKPRTIFDIDRITRWVNKTVPYNYNASYIEDEAELSLGTILKDIGAVCRHQTAVEFALLRLMGIHSFMRVMQNNESSHSYLQVFLPGDGPYKTLLTDPTHAISELDYSRFKELYEERYSSDYEMRLIARWQDGFQGAVLN